MAAGRARPIAGAIGEADVEVRMVDENGKIDLNQADAPLLTALCAGRGCEAGEMDQAQAARLAAAIIDWRDPDTLTQPAGGGEDARLRRRRAALRRQGCAISRASPN